MKLKKLLLSALLGTSLAASVQAVTNVVYIAGAPAFRSNSNESIGQRVNVLRGLAANAPLNSGLTATSGVDFTDTNIKSAKANQWRVDDYPTSGDVLIINATWTGSSSGIQSVATGTVQQSFITNGTGTIASRLANVTSAGAYTSYQPHISLSNTFQNSTQFLGTKTFPTGPSTSRTDTYASLHASAPLAISPYVWVASKGWATASGGVTNVTTQQLQALFRDGPQPLSFFSANPAHSGIYVVASGRDSGSGLRIAAQAEIGIGLLTPVQHFKPTITGGSIDGNGNLVGGVLQAGAPDIWPAGVVPSTGLYRSSDGDTGYPEFGGSDPNIALVSALTSQAPSSEYFIIAALEFSDVAKVTPSGAVALSYNGVPYSVAALQEGQYPFWAYQKLYRSNSLSGIPLTFANLLEANWVLGSSVNPASLHVGRTADGGTITHN